MPPHLTTFDNKLGGGKCFNEIREIREFKEFKEISV